MFGKSLFFALSTTALVSSQSVNVQDYQQSDVIYKDFAIIGGGAAGTYAAIYLKDEGKSFVVVEKSNRLGGHTTTYNAPNGQAADFGVMVFDNTTVVKDFFTRLNAPYKNLNNAQFGTSVYADFAEKKLLPNYSPGEIEQDYITQLNGYDPGANDLQYLKNPSSDLTLAWPDYVKKHGLSLNSTLATFNRPAIPGNLLTEDALYVFNDENNVMLNEHQPGGGLVNGNRNNSQMYENAKVELGNSVLYGSTVAAANRSTKNIILCVQTPNGHKLIVAKSLLIAMPQTLDNMSPFGLDAKEKPLISPVAGFPYYGGIVGNTGFNDSEAYANRGADTQYNVANLPSISTFSPTPIKGLHYYWYSSLDHVNQSTVESAATTAVNNLQQVLGLPHTTPTFPAYQDFTPLQLRVPSQNILNNYYQQFDALQGYRSTWYIGTFFVTGSSQTWNNTLNMLPSIIAAAS